jgi:hypothetical protein
VFAVKAGGSADSEPGDPDPSAEGSVRGAAAVADGGADVADVVLEAVGEPVPHAARTTRRSGSIGAARREVAMGLCRR